MNVPDSLLAYRAAGVIDRDDCAAVAMLVEMACRGGAAAPSPLAWLGMCLGLRTVRDGHTCVDLTRIGEWAGEIDSAAGGPLDWPLEAETWQAALAPAKALVGMPGDRKPFILDKHRLYLARSLAEEQAIADAIRARAEQGTIRILLGGPGTGKTTTVAKDLVDRFMSLGPEEATPSVALAAPTGKAAARMTEVLKKRCEQAGASADVIRAVTREPARTVHKLLGSNPRRGDRFEYHAGNCLPYGLVIVDEASMLSSTVMYHLLAAVKPESEILLVGDPDQLASVDAGTVLGDIAVFGGEAYVGSPLHSRIQTLTVNHRAESKPILELGAAIRASRVDDVFTILDSSDDKVVWVDPADRERLDAVTGAVVKHAERLRTAAGSGDPRAVLETKAELQVLCGHREGSMGVSGWNTRIEKLLGVRANQPWYSGRPVMVTRNSPSLRLANGDVGVVMPDGARQVAVFGLPDHSICMPVSRLEDIVTVHALTIHKSQGSEYEHVVVVLPERVSRIVTRELLYTGVTRAKTTVTIVSPRDVLEAAIKGRIRRATGLTERL